MRVEYEDVFDHTHRLVMEMLEKGIFSGLRVDHVDGLYDPATYLRRLREKLPQAYLIVEKILAMDETLPGLLVCPGDNRLRFPQLCQWIVL